MFDQFVSLASQYGWQGLAAALGVLVLVYLCRINGLVISGANARIANIVLSAIISGLNPLDPEASHVLVAVIASLGSALLYEFIRFAQKKLEEQAGKK